MTRTHQFLHSALLLCTLLLIANPILAADNYQICGNGTVEGAEQCDDGQNNSDTRANACRTDCTRATCGDSVTDNGEQCDDGPYNNDRIPDACRTDCHTAHCGDGVVDPEAGEYCEDGNNNPYDGCYQCQVCVPLKDDLTISSNQLITPAQGNVVTICPGSYEFTDQGKEGIIQVTGDNLVINASNVYLVGKPREFNRAAAAPKVNPALAQPKPGDRQQSPARLLAARLKRTNSQPTSSGSHPPAGPTTANAYHGTGFVVTGRNVVIENAQLQGFQTAIKLKATGSALFNNDLCNNARGVVAANANNFGSDNRCKNSQNWQEGGQNGCSASCN